MSQNSLPSGGGRSLGAKISGERVVPVEYFLVCTKLDTLCYLTVQTAPCYVPSFWHNTCVWQTDGRTDRQTDGIAVASTALAMPALRRAVKNWTHARKSELYYYYSCYCTGIAPYVSPVANGYSNICRAHDIYVVRPLYPRTSRTYVALPLNGLVHTEDAACMDSSGSSYRTNELRLHTDSR